MGTGIEMEENEIAFKCNFAVIDDETEIVTKSENYTNSYRRRADRHFEWGIPLWEAINDLEISNFLPDYLKDESKEEIFTN